MLHRREKALLLLQAEGLPVRNEEEQKEDKQEEEEAREKEDATHFFDFVFLLPHGLQGSVHLLSLQKKRKKERLDHRWEAEPTERDRERGRIQKGKDGDRKAKILTQTERCANTPHRQTDRDTESWGSSFFLFAVSCSLGSFRRDVLGH